MINNVVLAGRLTKDITLNKTTNGKSVTTFSLACRRDAQNTDFPFCRAYGKTAELLNQYCQKGSLIGVKGSIHTYTTESGGKKEFHSEVLADSIAFLDSKGGGQQATAADTDQVLVIDSEDLPF